MKLSNLLIAVDSIHKSSAAWRKEIGFMLHIPPPPPPSLYSCWEPKGLFGPLHRTAVPEEAHISERGTERVVQLFQHSAFSHITALAHTHTHSSSDSTSNYTNPLSCSG